MTRRLCWLKYPLFTDVGSRAIHYTHNILICFLFQDLIMWTFLFSDHTSSDPYCGQEDATRFWAKTCYLAELRVPSIVQPRTPNPMQPQSINDSPQYFSLCTRCYSLFVVYSCCQTCRWHSWQKMDIILVQTQHHSFKL